MRTRFLMLLISAIAIPLQAATIRVPQNQPTIQSGINAAVNGDTVLVGPGIYRGAGNFDLELFGKVIVVKGVHRDSVVINCEGSLSSNRRGFYVHQGEDSLTVISDLTIRNGVGELIQSEGFTFGGNTVRWLESKM
ncbi:MAG: hypothetical protein WBP42_11285 [Candidatus Zixiibacteriota bacterium]